MTETLLDLSAAGARDLVREGYALASHAYRGDEFALAGSGYAHWLRRFTALVPAGNAVRVSDDTPAAEYSRALSQVKGLGSLAAKYLEPRDADEHAVAMELVLEGLHQSSMLSRERTDTGRTGYKDMLKQMLSGLGDD